MSHLWHIPTNITACHRDSPVKTPPCSAVEVPPEQPAAALLGIYFFSPACVVQPAGKCHFVEKKLFKLGVHVQRDICELRGSVCFS